jgi:ArsR family transcriptional regulator, lead/cadmium/zinc/bismuth-responsive transcriptional repressor
LTWNSIKHKLTIKQSFECYWGEKMMKPDLCEIFCYDEVKVNRIRDQLKSIEFQEMAKVFKVLADETRLKIAYALCIDEELCVCDVANIIGSTTATSSHHLRLLSNMGLAKYRKVGKLVFYSLVNDHFKQQIELAIVQQKTLIPS